ncbi:ERC protein 2 [Eufriesea mexicana]|uniref:ERC protein 2 n=1 Tax=Eufriesea mexicana TaxID=516756 RepID=A0A310SKM9_9HYME|nr:ERC protein 2 [Eufriesea mexicana]
MSRDPYSSGSGVVGPGGGTRSPRSSRRVGELPTVDRSPSRSYASGRGSPLGRKRGTRSGNNSPEHLGYGSYHHHQLGSPYYSRDEDLASPVMLEERGRSMSTGGGGGGHHRSRSASRPAMSSSAGMSARYTSLDRASAGILDHDREFVPIRDPRERSRDRGVYLEDEVYGSRSARQSPNPHMLRDSGGYIGELQHQNNDLQRELGNLKKELELTNQKLGSSMHSIKTFWSPELKKERALRKEESSKYSMINEHLKLLSSENQLENSRAGCSGFLQPGKLPSENTRFDLRRELSGKRAWRDELQEFRGVQRKMIDRGTRESSHSSAIDGRRKFCYFLRENFRNVAWS